MVLYVGGLRRRAHVARWAIVNVLALSPLVSGCGGFATVSAGTPEAPPQCTATAADTYGWGNTVRQDDFNDPSSLTNWHLYDGLGHAGNGRRTPETITVNDGTLDITGDALGNSGGMGWNSGQMFGRWEVCAKSPVSAPGYHSLLLLWPDAEDWPVGGEIDFMETVDPARQQVGAWLHYGRDDARVGGTVGVDATQWHAWAVQWMPNSITMYLDGKPWRTMTDPATFPPGPLHLCMQVDNFGGDISAGGRQMVDWVRQYSLS